MLVSSSMMTSSALLDEFTAVEWMSTNKGNSWNIPIEEDRNVYTLCLKHLLSLGWYSMYLNFKINTWVIKLLRNHSYSIIHKYRWLTRLWRRNSTHISYISDCCPIVRWISINLSATLGNWYSCEILFQLEKLFCGAIEFLNQAGD